MPNLGEILRTNLPQDVMSQIEDVVGDDFDWDVVPRTRLNKVIAQRNQLASKVGASKANTEAGNEGTQIEGGVDLSKYVSKEDSDKALEDLKKQMESDNAQALADLRKQYAVSDMLRQSGALDPQLMIDSKLIDMSKIAFDKDNKMTGLDEQLTALKESKGFLFGKSKVPTGTGKNEQDDNDDGNSALDDQLNSVFESLGVPSSEK